MFRVHAYPKSNRKLLAWFYWGGKSRNGILRVESQKDYFDHSLKMMWQGSYLPAGFHCPLIYFHGRQLLAICLWVLEPGMGSCPAQTFPATCHPGQSP
jgi:hypothetical protein